MLASIAWRNLWRNPRRTLLTVAAVALGLSMMVFIWSWARAYGERMLDGLTGSFMGHIQIHEERYKTRRSSGRPLTDAEAVLAAVRQTKGVEAAAGRIFGFGHVTFVRGEDSAVREGGGDDVASPVVALLGVDAEHEIQVTDLNERISEGRWLQGETDVVVGAGLARQHGLRLGDAFVPTVVDSTGAMRGPWAVSADVPRVVGIVRTGVDQIDDRMAILPRQYLAELSRMEDQVHEITIRASESKNLDPVVADIRLSLREVRSNTGAHEPPPATVPFVATVAGSRDEVPADEGDAAPVAADAGLPAAAAEPTRVRLVGVPVPASAADADGEERLRGELIAGGFLRRSEDIVLSRSTAAALELSPGDHMEIAVPVDCGEDVPAAECPPSSETFRVAGIVGGQEELLGGAFGLVAAPVLQENIAALAPGSVSPLAADDAQQIVALVRGVRGEVAVTDDVKAWYDLSPELRQMLEAMDVGPMIFLIIIFLAVSLGIVNTLLMATFERTRELGLMKALGMRPYKIVAMVMTECAQLALVGTALGLFIGVALVLYFGAYGLNLGVFSESGEGFSFSGITIDPVLWPSLAFEDLLRTSIPVLIMTTLAGIWPAIRAARLNASDALRHE